MNWKIVRTAAVAVFTAALLAAWLLWLRASPSLAPDDVALRGKLLPVAGLAGAQAAGGEAWAAQLQVQRSKPVAADDVVYLYVPGYQGSKYEIVEDNGPGAISMVSIDTISAQVRSMLEQTGLSVSAAELTEQGLAYKGTLPSYTVRAYLKPQPGLTASPSSTASPKTAAPTGAPNATPAAAAATPPTATGAPAPSSAPAAPSGAAPTASAPDAPAPAQAIVPDGPAYAVYIHQERRYGKNVGWTKAVKLEPQQQ